MFQRKFNSRQTGQSTMEYVVVFTILMAALLTMQTYFKRAMAGRWKAAVDDLGDQYDPRTANTLSSRSSIVSTNSTLWVVNRGSGLETHRIDITDSTDVSDGTTQVGQYEQK
ncbi:MAG: hypothetical protein HQL23_08415 [Candidatus Omnitrophica bacterium]|nr:hypothetical protein [Candidatus Omnitrophota bacterium]